jgi:hypothetical protein
LGLKSHLKSLDRWDLSPILKLFSKIFAMTSAAIVGTNSTVALAFSEQLRQVGDVPRGQLRPQGGRGPAQSLQRRQQTDLGGQGKIKDKVIKYKIKYILDKIYIS